MKKIFISFLILLLLVVSCIAGVLFTKFGNDKIARYIEDRVNKEQNKVTLKVDNFDLSLDEISFNARIDDNSNININGNFDIFKQSIDLKYDIKVKDLANLQKLINKRLNGSFATKGSVVGDKKLILVKGVSNIANSDTKYDVNLVDFDLKTVNLDLKQAKIEKLLYLLNEPIYTKGLLNINAKIKNAHIENLDGDVVVSIKEGKVQNKIINKKFKQNITIPISYKSDIKALLKGKEIKVKSDIISSLAFLHTKKSIINLNSNKIFSDYLLDIKNLAKFESIIGKKLNGSFSTNGDIKIEDKDISIKGYSNLAKSKTSYDVNIKNSKLDNISFDVNDLKIDSLLKIVNEPIYAFGNLSLKGKLKNDDFLKGTINSKIEKGFLVNKNINKAFNMKLKDKINFTMNNENILDKDMINSHTKLLTSLGDILLDKSQFNIKEKRFTSVYEVLLPDLRKLKDITSKKLRGDIKLSGNIEKKDKYLSVDGNANLVGGKLDFTLLNDVFKANLKDGQIKDLTYMLYYPAIFSSVSNLDLNYNILTKKGTLKGKLSKGNFIENKLSILIKQFTNFDMTREVYDNVILHTDINDTLLSSDLDMESKNTKISIKKSKMDLEKNTIDAKIQADINKVKLSAKVTGDINSPKISLDTKAFLKSKVGKKLEKKLNKKIDKIIEKNIKSKDVKEGLNQLKSLFQ